MDKLLTFYGKSFTMNQIIGKANEISSEYAKDITMRYLILKDVMVQKNITTLQLYKSAWQKTALIKTKSLFSRD